MTHSRASHLPLYLPYVANKRGLEIGGPSDVFRRGQPLDLYKYVTALDNCNFSQSTVWGEQDENYTFDSEKKPGKSLFCDGSALVSVKDSTYDFVLSSHNLEHFANPVKALKEWKRVIRPSSALILAIPYYRWTFDHRRKPTCVDHMMEDFARDVGEDDLTHLPEIMEKHDLSMDPGAGSAEEFRKRSLDNFSNRCLHHHVFDKTNSSELLRRTGFNVQAIDLVFPCHICILATVNNH
ncbi:MAG: methyltransferase domain-containing protein [Edaphobacter sp.]